MFFFTPSGQTPLSGPRPQNPGRVKIDENNNITLIIRKAYFVFGIFYPHFSLSPFTIILPFFIINYHILVNTIAYLQCPIMGIEIGGKTCEYDQIDVGGTASHLLQIIIYILEAYFQFRFFFFSQCQLQARKA